ncbi:hypothetical protein VTK56DRAFT_3598 [Thermocarpiscus australiensis]
MPPSPHLRLTLPPLKRPTPVPTSHYLLKPSFTQSRISFKSRHRHSTPRRQLISTSFTHQATMDCTSYPVIEADTFLCWLYTFANRCHAFEIWLGIPPWISYFSEPDMPANQLSEAILLLGTVALFGLVAPISNILRPASRRGWFRRCLRWLGGSIAMAWLTVWVVSTEPVVQEFLVGLRAKCHVQVRTPSKMRPIPTWVTLALVLCHWIALPALRYQIDPVLCWFTSKGNVSDIPEPQRSLGTMVGIWIVTFPMSLLLLHPLVA